VAGAVLTALPRVYLALKDHSVFWPDEIYQSVEAAHRVAFGYGLISWEFRDGARSWILPGILAVIFKITSIFTDRSLLLVELVKLFMVAVSVAATLLSIALAQRLEGKRAAWLTALLVSTFPPLLVFSHRATPEMMSAPLLVLAMWWGVAAPGRAAWAGAAMGLAVTFRMQTAPVALVLFANFVRLRDFTSAARFVSAAAAVFGLGGLLDWITWGRPFNSTIEYMTFTLRGGASTFGVDPPSFYFKTLWSAGGPTVLLLGFGLAFAFRDQPALVVGVVAFVFGHLLIPHKEFRFISPAMHVALTASAVGLVRFAEVVKAPTWLNRLAASACVLVAVTKAPALTNRDLGLYIGQPSGSASVWRFGQDPTMLLARAGERPDLCGVVTLGLRAGFTGGYSYLHRDVPLLYRHQLCGEQKAANYLIAPVNAGVPPEFQQVERIGDTALFRRPGDCVRPQSLDYMLEGADDMGLRKAPIEQPDKKEFKISAGTSGAAFERGWGTGERLGCRAVRWAVGTSAEMRFPLRTSGDAYTLSFSALPFSRAMPQEVSVKLNGHAVRRFALGNGWQGYQAPIPPAELVDGINTLHFEFARAVRASERDPRELAVLFEQVGLVPVSSLADIDVGTGNGRAYLVSGFSVDEQNGERSWAWSDGPRSRASITLSGANRPQLLQVSALAYMPTAPQTVRVTVNSRLAGTLDIPSRWSWRGLVLDAGMLREGVNQLDFEYSSTRRPADTNAESTDQRNLAVMFDRIVIGPAPDRTRVDFGEPSANRHELAGFSTHESTEGRSATWSEGTSSRFVIAGGATQSEQQLNFQLRAFDPLGHVRADVFVNGSPVGYLEPDTSWDTRGVRIPAGKMRREANVVELRYARTARPKDTLPGSVDERELAVQLDAVTLQAAADNDAVPEEDAN
jgi:GPI mannosyltransferase 3